MSKNFYITTAIPYGNGAPHIGHAYEAIATDVTARFKRLDGYNVHFLSGMDEHGQKMEQTAAKQGLSPQQLADQTAALFKDMHQKLVVEWDDFIRTTEDRHKKAAADFWQKMVDAGDIYLDKYAGWYSVRDEAYFGEDELSTNEAGKKLAPSGAPVEWVEEESYFFRLSKYQEKLLALYEKNQRFIQPKSRRNEIVQFVKSGLKDLSVSRTTFQWGIPVPGNPKHVMYVWVDALSNYITALGYPDANGRMKDFWPVDFHMIGKDITRFHAIYWPAFLMSAGLPTPKSIFGHGFIYNRGEKMSKSVGNIVSPHDLIKAYGVDQTRYFLMREIAFGQDGDYTHEAMVKRINGDLANDLGNLAQRSLSMIQKNCEGKVPTAGDFSDADKALLAKAYGLLPEVRQLLDDQLAFHNYLDAVWKVIGDGNRYVDEQAPWSLKKTDPVRMATVLYVLAEIVRVVAILLQPVMPLTMPKLLDQLSVAEAKRNFETLRAEGALHAGEPLPPPTGVFPRYVEPEREAS
jgi:methionyl-tRNA synthetase